MAALTGTAIALGDVVSDSIASAGEVDSYVVTVPAGISISFDALSSDNVGGLNWRIQNQYGRVVLSNTVSIQDQGPVALAGGDYQVDVFGEGGTQTGNYSFRVVDSSPEQAAILIGDTVSGDIDVPGDSDVYSFTAAPGQIVFLNMITSSNAAGLDWLLEDAFGRAVLVRTTDLNDKGPIALMGGAYTLSVLGETRTEGPGQTGTYQFELVNVVDDTSAIAIGDTVVGAIDHPGQMDMFTFSASAGQRVLLDQISTSNNNGLDWILEDSYGRRLLGQTSSLADAGPVTLMGGSYTLTILGEGDSTGTYEFDLAEVTDSQTAIAIGDVVSDAIDPGQIDRYTFTAAAGQKIVLDQIATSNLNLLNWSLSDSAGRLVLAQTTSLNDQGPITLMGGTYTLSVLGEQAGSTGTYQFQILDVIDDTAGLNAGDSMSGSIDPGSTDTWTFSAAAGQVVTLDLTATSNSAGLNWSLEDAYGRSVLARTTSLADQGPFILMGGSYAIRVLGETATAGGTYDFTLVDGGIDTSFVPSGTVIMLGDTVSSQIAVSGSPDEYRFTVASGETIFLDLLAGASSLRWSLLDSVGQPVFSLVQANNAGNQNQGPFVLAGGEYVLRLEDAGTATPSYSFTLVDVVDGMGVFNLGDTVPTTFTTPGAVQAYDVTLGSETEVYFHLDASSSNVFWTLADPAGQPVFDNAQGNSGRGPYTLVAGTYSLLLDPRNDTVPSFTFTMAAVSHTSGTFAVGDVVGDTIPSYAGTNEHLVTLSAGERIYADLQVGAGGLSWSMIDPEGEAVFHDVSAQGTGSGDRGPYTLAGGEYRIVFGQASGSPASYQFRLWEVQDQVQAAPLDAQVASTFTAPGQTLTYELPIAMDGDAFYFDNQLGSGSTTCTLLDPVGQVIFGPFGLGGTASADRGPYPLAAGTYAIQLTTSGGSLPSFMFTPWDSPQTSGTLTMESAVMDDIAAPGSTHSYSFTAAEGQKLFFDVTADTTGMTWSLIDPLGVATGLIDAVAANSAAGDDVGPLRLEAGNYTLVLDGDASGTPHYEFIVKDMAFDLTPLSVTASPEILTDGEVGRSVDVSWTVLNDGGNEVNGTWTDRIVVSADDVAGNGDDVLLGEFSHSGPLASRATYSRMETLPVPDSLGLGSYLVFVIADAGDDITENLGEGNNVAEQPLTVTATGDQGSGLITVESFSPVGFSSTGTLYEIDFPLAEVVSLDQVRFVSAEAFQWDAGFVLGSGNLALVLMHGQQEVLEVGSTGASGNLFYRVYPVIRFGRDVTPAEIAALPTTMVDGVRFRVTSSGSGFTSTLASIFPDGKLRLHFVQCEFGPCGPHEKQEYTGLDSVTWSGSDPSPTPFLEYDLTEPVPMHGLRYLFAGPWLWTWSYGSPRASLELQIRLNDGSVITLDDRDSPSTGSTPASAGFVLQHSLLLDDVTQEEVDDLWAVGFRWRVHAAGNGFTVYPGCPSSGSGICGTGTPFQLFFLYDFGECAGQPAVAPIDLSPMDGDAFTSGSRVVLSGSVIAPENQAPVAAVLVNGAPVDSFDAAGRFFKTEQVAEGENLYQIDVIQPACGESSTDLSLLGVIPQDAAFLNLADVSNSITASYSNMTFFRGPDYAVFDVTACNSGDDAVLGPLEMIVTGTSAPSIVVARPEGLTSDGKPFVVVDDLGGPDRLMPGQCTAAKKLAFYNPRRLPLRFTSRWLSRSNSPPEFETGPPARATINQTYSYDADAVDANGDPLTYSLPEAPASMTIDAMTGEVSWTPILADAGTHSIVLEVSDGVGGTARQEWTLAVGDGSSNSAPFFTSAPPARAATGASLTYQAVAVDADGDALTYSMPSGPSGAGIDSMTGELTWPFTLPGNHLIEISVDDGHGGASRQTWTLTVGAIAANPTVPSLFGSPASTATVGEVYFYQPVAGNLDSGETATFTLDVSPTGMTVDPATGRVTWTPGSGQTGANLVTLTVGDGNGASSSQSWTIDVSSTPANRPPVIVTVPDLYAVVGEPWSYPSHAVDPEADVVTYALVSPPAGMAMDANIGLVTWTPAATGPYTVAIQATDTMGAFGAQVFTLEVLPVNDPPVISSTPPAAHGIVGAVFQYDVEATDPEAQELAFSLVLAPSGMTVHPQSGLISWLPNQAQAGTHSVTVRVEDGHRGSAEQDFTVEIDPDLVAPEAHLALSSAQVAIDAQAQACVEASDDIGVVSRTLLIDGVPAALDPLGCLIITRPAPVLLTLRAEAYDMGGNLGYEEATLNVVDPSNGTAPTVTLISPLQESVLTAPTDITATITDDDPSYLTWEVKVAPEDTGVFTTIASGSGEITGGILANFDTTMRRNGSYRVQILGSDGVQTKGVEFRYHVSGELKMGQFEITFNDAIIPLAGFPMVITRRYNSLDTSKGDFGAGWRLGLPGDIEDSAAENAGSTPLADLLDDEPFSRSTRIYVTRPDGKRVGFSFDPAQGFLFTATARFTADPGVTDTLEAVGPTTVWDIGGSFFDYMIPYNPRTFILTTLEGVRYTIDESDGLQLIEDTNGNTITVSPGGMVSSTGLSVSFDRDTENRITRVLLPDANPNDIIPPGELDYDYDMAGNLVAFRDPLDHEVVFHYDEPSYPNYLTSIEDPLGRDAVRSVFDTDGRLIAQCDPDGDIVTLDGCTKLSYDVDLRIETVFDARGFRNDYLLDSLGRVLEQQRYLDATNKETWLYSYDSEGNVTSTIDPAGSTWSFTYDEQGNALTRTDPLGRTWSATYAECGNMASACDPLGNCHIMTYDENCNALSVTNPLGDVTEFEYGGRGLRTLLREPNGNEWHFVYDALGRLYTLTDPAKHTETLFYNNLGDLVSRTDRRGLTTTWEYDVARNILTETWDTPTPTVIDFTYDDAGRVTTATDGTSTMSYGYRNDGLLSHVDNTGSTGVPAVAYDYEYDGNGNLTAAVDSAGGRTEYDYDFRNRVVAIRQFGTGIADKLLVRSYDDLTGDSVATRYSDLAAMLPVSTTEYDVECSTCRNRMAALRHRRASDNGVIQDIVIARDGGAQITQIDDLEGTHTYAYDGMRRLVSGDHPGGGVQPDEQYSYDGAGNRVSSHRSATATYAYELPDCASLGECGNELIDDDQFSYEYDAEGSLTRRTNLSSGDYETFTYDHRRRLTAWNRFDALDTPLESASYAYDLANHRIRSEEQGVVRYYGYDGENPALVFDGSLSLISRRLYARPADHILAEEVGGNVRWFLADQVGSVRDVVDNSETVLNHYVYDSFGVLVDESSPGFANDLRFTAREFSDTTGLGHYRSRTYEPAIGRFLSRDPRAPFGFDYARNDPLSLVDPAGTEAIEYSCLSVFSASVSLELVKLLYGQAQPFIFERAINGQDPDSPWVNLFQTWAEYSKLAGDLATEAQGHLEGNCAVTVDSYLNGDVIKNYFDLPGGPCDFLPEQLQDLCGFGWDWAMSDE